MRADVRNSLNLWAGGLLIFALLWAVLHFDLVHGLAGSWVGQVIQGLGILNFAGFLWGIWQRRESNPRNPNRK